MFFIGWNFTHNFKSFFLLLAVLRKTFSIGKNRLQVSKSEKKIKITSGSRHFFWEKKIPPGSRCFFWNHKRSEVPPATLTPSVLKPCALKPCEAKCPRLVLHVLCWSRVHLSRAHKTIMPSPDSHCKAVIMREWANHLRTDQKRFWFFNRNKVQVKKKKPIFENLRKTFSIRIESDFNFQNRGFLS